MIIAGISIMSAAVILTTVSICMEIYAREPKWMVLMKVGAMFFGVGGVLFGVAMAT